MTPMAKPHGYFNTLNTALKKQGQQLGLCDERLGMYHDEPCAGGVLLEKRQ